MTAREYRAYRCPPEVAATINAAPDLGLRRQWDMIWADKTKSMKMWYVKLKSGLRNAGSLGCVFLMESVGK
jgi:hypothetical protein